ncbi:CsbD family protein [Streptomyces hesseae]|uniref:CsbD family protein n=1 Tax=Streptomyces hesseae TaxID=3075519 RepID=A0ABU2SHQ4_9ACTN|nr:CsbD family protein [Streptomyces sp. DSM 40473]MDT0448508.1 CsbD family protein [Streptomyces sp. DSM 40473]
MGKAKAKAKQVKGSLKETTGRLTGDRKQEAKGHIEKLEGKAQEAAAKIRKPGK